MKSKYALEIKLTTGEIIERLEADSARTLWIIAWSVARKMRGECSCKFTFEDQAGVVWGLWTSRWERKVEFIALREQPHAYAYAWGYSL